MNRVALDQPRTDTADEPTLGPFDEVQLHAMPTDWFPASNQSRPIQHRPVTIAQLPHHWCNMLESTGHSLEGTSVHCHWSDRHTWIAVSRQYSSNTSHPFDNRWVAFDPMILNRGRGRHQFQLLSNMPFSFHLLSFYSMSLAVVMLTDIDSRWPLSNLFLSLSLSLFCLFTRRWWR